MSGGRELGSAMMSTMRVVKVEDGIDLFGS